MPKIPDAVGRLGRILEPGLFYGQLFAERHQLPQVLMLQTRVHVTIILFFFLFDSTRQKNIHPNEFRLPEDIVPIKYTLSLLVDMEKQTTEGRVSIWLKVVRPTKQITFHVHSKLVTVKKNGVRVIDMGTNKNQTVRKYSQNKTKEFGTVNLTKKLKAGTSVKLFIPFEGRVRDLVLKDLFLSEDGSGGQMAVTGGDDARV